MKGDSYEIRFVVCRSRFHSFRWLTLGFALMAMTPGADGRRRVQRRGADAKAQQAIALFRSIEWQDGPGDRPAWHDRRNQDSRGLSFHRQDGARKWAELNENIPSNSDMGVLMPKAKAGWFIVFTYEDSGHIADDEKGNLDAAAILRIASPRQQRRECSSDASEAGLRWISSDGKQQPAYEDATHHLIWALRVRSEGQESINYNTRILGRTGVMSANLVVNPEKLRQCHRSLPSNFSAGYQFTAGSKYAEWRSGDKVAQYGLTGLITGGLVVAAAKMRPLGQARRADRQVRQADHHRRHRPGGRNRQVLQEHFWRRKQGKIVRPGQACPFISRDTEWVMIVVAAIYLFECACWVRREVTLPLHACWDDSAPCLRRRSWATSNTSS